MARFVARLAHGAVTDWRRRGALLLVVLVAFAGAVVAFAGEFKDDFRVPGSDAQRATDLLVERFPQAAGDTATIVFTAEDGSLRSAAAQGVIADVVKGVRAHPGVTGVTAPVGEQGAPQISRDGRIAFADVQYDAPAAELGTEPYERLEEAVEQVEGRGVSASLRGPVVDQGATHIEFIGELLGLAVAMIVLTLVFRSVAAMTLTLVVSLVSVLTAVGLLLLGARLTTLSTSAPTLALMLGLGAGIDYALLIFARYRENLARGDAPALAAGRAGATAGVSVLTAAAIVIVAITGLLVVGIPFVGKLGFASGLAVAVVAVGAITMLPIAAGAAGRRLVPVRGHSAEPPAGLVRWGEGLVARRWVVLPLVCAALLALAFPLTNLRLGTPDDSVKPSGQTQRAAYDALARGFGVGFNGPILLAAATDPGDRRAQATLARLAERVQADPGVASVAPAVFSEKRDAAILTVVPTTAPQDARTSELLERLRDQAIPAATAGSATRVYAGGLTAVQEDLAERITSRLPLFIGVVVGLALLLLMAAFRSVLVPLVSAGFNLLSVGAAYGATVLVFQEGVGGELVGVEQPIPIVSSVPLFMFALLFGLSMDYNVFQQSRIREEYLHGKGARRAVVDGFAATAKVIAAAGAIMVAVFGAFLLNSDVTIKTIGFGLAVAILIDVVFVRFLLAPAVIAALGDRAWSLPAALDRVLPRIALEGDESALREDEGLVAADGQREPDLAGQVR